MSVRILEGDCRDVLRTLPDASVHCCVTSPPYWGLRDYGIPPSNWGGDPACEHRFANETIATEIGKGNWAQGVNGRGEQQPGGVDAKREPIRATSTRGFCRCGAWRGTFGLEPTPALYVEHAVMAFREVRRVLRDDGTLWLNLGDSYASGTIGRNDADRLTAGLAAGHGGGTTAPRMGTHSARSVWGKPKDLVGIPWRVAFALQADGWYLRQDIIWAKPNPMPESVTDRCTKSHEYLFLLSKAPRYYFDADAIKEDCVQDESRPSFRGGAYINNSTFDNAEGGKSTDTGNIRRSWKGSEFQTGKTAEHQLSRSQKVRSPAGWKTGPGAHGSIHDEGREQEITYAEIDASKRNKRSVWTIATAPFKEAHFATFPPALIEPCILAGCPIDGTVLDPFGGAGTTGLVADRLQRSAILIELNPEYAAIARKRINGDAPLFAEVV
jgi:site-specific DNA-methyltransferase (adenine-specific)